MALEVLSERPQLEAFTALEEHQSQTPGTFFGGKPVLHCKHAGVTLQIPQNQLQSHAAIAKLQPTAVVDGPTTSQLATISNVEIWVTSERFVLFQLEPSNTGVSIPYPSIALHAISRFKGPQYTSSEVGLEALYMELSLNDTELVNAEDEIEVLEVTVLPPNYASVTESTTPYIKELFAAMNTCSDLHPDPASPDSDEEDEGEDTAPGAGGWITSENMDQYFDEAGNFIGGGTLGDADGNIFGRRGNLGAGAGTVRTREEDDEAAHGSNGVDGTNGEDETKWRRTE
ncbi:uncharacterized protein BDZ99DRAFT_402857 [Mytilinidion resinicola]|uniref:Regulator of volume decrease after cellular swelling-domain-containing protein n=1 Tax=Mytilinidion resinicola TaxID=574789 RepID=A0A6A6XYW4_9PEZI|nr:uncharacterized protein BDZ99DRAFT_402857 [Mytilinidion resinicola]KAF2801751.1 hypothetical protein BDZ99DRAFT_402857 [Mytilinidion resinicola]